MFGRVVSVLGPAETSALKSLVQCQTRMSLSSSAQPVRNLESAAQGVDIKGKSEDPTFQEILTADALGFVAKLHREFNPTRLQLLKAREERYVFLKHTLNTIYNDLAKNVLMV